MALSPLEKIARTKVMLLKGIEIAKASGDKAALHIARRRLQIFAQSVDDLVPPERMALARWDWGLQARPEQLPPTGDWRWWVIMAGRGFGKTRTAAELVRGRVETGRASHVGLIAQDPLAAMTIMIDGPSGLKAVASPGHMPDYNRSTKTLTWPNGAKATVFSAEDPAQLRGPEHDLIWADEFAALKNLEEVFANADFGLRRIGPKGDPAQGVVSTTPRPRKTLKELVQSDGTFVTNGSTFDNATNLDPETVKKLRKKYKGTRLGRQELFGEILTDVEGALWKPEWIEEARVQERPNLVYACVAVDPAASSGPLSSETGIIGGGRGEDGDGYILEDHSGVLSPKAWGQRAVDMFWTLDANEIVAEVNNGGEMVRTIIHDIDSRIPVRMVRAAIGKMRRAEPIASLYEPTTDKPCRVHHVGVFEKLEDQQTSYTGAAGETSPDRLDAAVWCLWAAMIDPYEEIVIR